MRGSIKVLLLDFLTFWIFTVIVYTLAMNSDWEVKNKVMVFGFAMYLYGSIIDRAFSDVRKRLKDDETSNRN